MLEKPDKLIFEQKKVKKEIWKWYKELENILDKYYVWEEYNKHTKRMAKCEKNELILEAERIRSLMMKLAFGEKLWNERFIELQKAIEMIENYPN